MRRQTVTLLIGRLRGAAQAYSKANRTDMFATMQIKAYGENTDKHIRLVDNINQ